MADRKIAQRYAVALYLASKKLGLQNEIKERLQLFSSIFADKKVFNYFASPKIKLSQKENTILRSLPEDTPLLLKNFLRHLLFKKRMDCIHYIQEGYNVLYDIDQNILKVNLKTSVPLDNLLRDKILKKLKETTGKNIILREEIDKNILGGILVKIGDRVIDGTIISSLRTLKENLLSIKI